MPQTHLILDPFMIKAIEGITAKQLFDAFIRLYEHDFKEEDFLEWIEKWLLKARKRPASAFSTGRRNSLRGEMTCALLDILEVPRPKMARPRIDLAWAILNSQAGRANVGHVPELEAEREIATSLGYGVND